MSNRAHRNYTYFIFLIRNKINNMYNGNIIIEKRYYIILLINMYRYIF